MSTMFLKDKKGPSINPVALYIPTFKAVWDKYEDKDMSERELAYVYYVSDYKSDYSGYSNNRAMVVAKDIMPKGWKPDEITNEAVKTYKHLQKTTSIHFLEWSRSSISSITEYFKSNTINEDDTDEVKAMKITRFDPTRVVKLLKDVEPILTKLENLEEKILREENIGQNKIRGGGDIGFFEDPDAMNFLEAKWNLK